MTRKHAEQCNFLLDSLEQDAGTAGTSELSPMCNGFISYANDFTVSSDDDDADGGPSRNWPWIDQSTSCCTKWYHRPLFFKDKLVVLGTERNSMAADEDED